MKKRLLMLAVIGGLLGGCATAPERAKTSLELQAFQAKDFSVRKEVAFASTVSVFQDLGYIVEAADVATGLITAKSPTTGGFVPFVGQTQNHTKATAFVEEYRKGVTKIRLNFVEIEKTSSGYGMEGGRDTPVEDPSVYQNAFAKIQEAIFIRTATN